MEAIPYKLRLQLSDEIPQEGQRRVMARIPAFDVPEIDNSFSAPAGGGKTLLGMVLGPLAEKNFRRAMVVSGGSAEIFFTRPISCAFILIAVGSVLLFAWRNYKARSKAKQA